MTRAAGSAARDTKRRQAEVRALRAARGLLRTSRWLGFAMRLRCTILPLMVGRL